MNYQLRISQRAKHARIRIKPSRQIEVVLPMGMSKCEADILIKQQHQWIIRTLAHMPEKPSDSTLPECIDLKAIAEHIAVKYDIKQKQDICWHAASKQLNIATHVDDIPHVLRRWLKDYAKLHIKNMLDEVAQEMGVSYTSVSIRLQKTRWGSCSYHKSISLNAKLLLLPKEQARYVLVHELAHLKHMNHSAPFWQYVAKFEPNYNMLRKAIRHEGMLLPSWLLL